MTPITLLSLFDLTTGDPTAVLTGRRGGPSSRRD